MSSHPSEQNCNYIYIHTWKKTLNNYFFYRGYDRMRKEIRGKIKEEGIPTNHYGWVKYYENNKLESSNLDELSFYILKNPTKGSEIKVCWEFKIEDNINRIPQINSSTSYISNINLLFFGDENNSYFLYWGNDEFPEEDSVRFLNEKSMLQSFIAIWSLKNPNISIRYGEIDFILERCKIFGLDIYVIFEECEDIDMDLYFDKYGEKAPKNISLNNFNDIEKKYNIISTLRESANSIGTTSENIIKKSPKELTQELYESSISFLKVPFFKEQNENILYNINVYNYVNILTQFLLSDNVPSIYFKVTDYSPIGFPLKIIYSELINQNIRNNIEKIILEMKNIKIINNFYIYSNFNYSSLKLVKKIDFRVRDKKTGHILEGNFKGNIKFYPEEDNSLNPGFKFGMDYILKYIENRGNFFQYINITKENNKNLFIRTTLYPNSNEIIKKDLIILYENEYGPLKEKMIIDFIVTINGHMILKKKMENIHPINFAYYEGIIKSIISKFTFLK